MDDTLIRILELMQEKEISETEIQRLIGVPKGSFSNWKRNSGHSYYRYVDVIADRLGVTIDYLIRGHETFNGAMTEEEVEVLNNYRRLTPKGKKVIAENIKLIINSCE